VELNGRDEGVVSKVGKEREREGHGARKGTSSKGVRKELLGGGGECSGARGSSMLKKEGLQGKLGKALRKVKAEVGSAHGGKGGQKGITIKKCEKEEKGEAIL